MVLTTTFIDGSVGRIEGDIDWIITALKVTDMSTVEDMVIRND